ncbi:MAG: hypothetical protein WC022_01815, partial [Parcubacteria group bacterium]
VSAFLWKSFLGNTMNLKDIENSSKKVWKGATENLSINEASADTVSPIPIYSPAPIHTPPASCWSPCAGDGEGCSDSSDSGGGSDSGGDDDGGGGCGY